MTFFSSSSKIISHFHKNFILRYFFWQKHLHTWKPESTDKLYSDRLFCPINSIRAMTFRISMKLFSRETKGETPKHCPRILDLYILLYFVNVNPDPAIVMPPFVYTFLTHEFFFILNEKVFNFMRHVFNHLHFSKRISEISWHDMNLNKSARA